MSLFLLLSLVSTACASDDASIVFLSDRDGHLDVYVIDMQEQKEVNLTQNGEDERTPLLAPSKKRLAFLSGPSGDMAIEVQDLETPAAVPVPFTDKGVYRTFRWALDSQRLAFIAEHDGAPSLFVKALGDTTPTLVTSMEVDEVGGWSPSGDWVVFAVWEGPGQGIYKRNPEGVNQIRLTEGPDWSPTWSPDSRHIAFLSTRDGNAEIYVIKQDGKDLRRLTHTAATEASIQWAPNSKSLLFVSDRDGNQEIYAIDLGGGEQKRLTYNEVEDAQPVWSPDGKRIAFVSYLDGDAEIIVMKANGEEQTRLTNNEAEDTSPSW